MVLVMSMLFRSTAALSRTPAQALAPSAILLLGEWYLLNDQIWKSDPSSLGRIYWIRHPRQIHARVDFMDPMAESHLLRFRVIDHQRVLRKGV